MDNKSKFIGTKILNNSIKNVYRLKLVCLISWSKIIMFLTKNKYSTKNTTL